MKLISLNTWGGRLSKELIVFLATQAKSTDIFCFQEVLHDATKAHEVAQGLVDSNLFTTIAKTLPNHQGYFASIQDNYEGLAIFIRRGVAVEDVDDVFVHRHLNAMQDKDGSTVGRTLQYVRITQDDQEYVVCNFHGLWNGRGKGDTPDRLAQSERVKAFLRTRVGSNVVLVGDFNLDPDTKSMAIIQADMRNLITENNITSTRSHYYKWPNKLADYALVSRGVNVRRFEVLQDVASDHLPLLMVFS